MAEGMDHQVDAPLVVEAHQDDARVRRVQAGGIAPPDAPPDPPAFVKTEQGVVGGHVLHGCIHQNCRHNACHRVRGLILGILAAAVLVVVLDQVFKDGGEEIKLLLDDALKAEVHQRVDQRAAEGVALRTVGDVIAQLVEQDDLRSRIGLDRENVIVENGDVAQRVIEEFGELPVIHTIEQMG